MHGSLDKQEFRQDPRFRTSVIVVVTNRLEERPAWMAEEMDFFDIDGCQLLAVSY